MDNFKFKIAQSAIIRNADDNILILRHKEGRWLLPGGRLKATEPWHVGLRREVAEETGIVEFAIQEICDIDTWVDVDGWPTYGVTFLCQVRSTPRVVLSDEHRSYVWIQTDDVDRFDFWNSAVKDRIVRAASDEGHWRAQESYRDRPSIH